MMRRGIYLCTVILLSGCVTMQTRQVADVTEADTIILTKTASQGPVYAVLIIGSGEIDGEGEISLNGDSVDLPGLEQFLSSSMGRNSSPGVAIRGDSESAYGLVFSVIDLVKRSGIEKIHLSYRRKEESTGDGS